MYVFHPPSPIMFDVSFLREGVDHFGGISVADGEFVLNHSGGDVAVFVEKLQYIFFGKCCVFVLGPNKFHSFLLFLSQPSLEKFKTCGGIICFSVDVNINMIKEPRYKFIKDVCCFLWCKATATAADVRLMEF